MDIVALVVILLVAAALAAVAYARYRPKPVAPTGHQHLFVPRTIQVGHLSLTVEECACGERRLG